MEKLQKLFAKLPAEIDAAFITSDINRRYFSGMKSSAGTVIAFREKAYLLIDFRYFEKASKTVKNCEVILLKNTQEQISELLKKHNAKTAAVETHSMTLHEFAGFKEKFPELEFVTNDVLSNAINELRAEKSAEEISKIKQAQKIAEEAFLNVLDYIKPGRTEKEIAFALDSYMLTHGAEGISFDTIALSGSNTSLPHGVPSEKKISAGEFVLMDFGAVYEGYHSDMTRTVCVGESTEKMRRVYNIVLEAQEKALAAAHAGMTGSGLDKISRDIIAENGFGAYFGHSLGHGVGMEIHEFPNASPSNKTILEENTVITVEPGIYLPGEFGVRIEDFVVITKSGCENLTKSQKNLIVL